MHRSITLVALLACNCLSAPRTNPNTTASAPAVAHSDAPANAPAAPLKAAAPPVLAATPPMGWNSWNKFGCNVTEDLIKGVADAMVTSGMQAAGYQYVNIDDCWQVSRDDSGTIVADPARFPGGMHALADYVHSKGLKLGVYSDRGTRTCAGRPGSQDHETQDANTYASWGVDYLKYDNCNADDSRKMAGYSAMRRALSDTGRPIVFSICAWSFENWMTQVGQLWRTTGDISDNWASMIKIVDSNERLAPFASVGHWNDPDMLEIGNGGMTDVEYRSHFSLWAIMAAPLIAGNDLRSMSPATRDILTAQEIIAVDQDPAGKQGRRVVTSGDLEVWSKPLATPKARAVALFNRGPATANVTVQWTDIGLDAGDASVRDLWARKDLGTIRDRYTTEVPSHGTAMLKITAR